MHGSIYAVMKTEGELHERIKKWVKKTIIFFILCYGGVTMTTLIFIPHMIAPFKAYPVLFAIPVITLLAIANIPRAISKQQYFFAFISSSGAIVMFLALTAIGLFPNLVLASNNPAHSLTIYNASASQKTLEYMTVIAVFGVPVVLAYTFGIYWVFKGKVKLDSMSY
jgi:cytochrome d ubiquinol oxidase subunit II